MNPAYLHTPITTADQVRALLPADDRPGAAESLTLDFKAMPWGHKTKKGRDSEVEFACDVAAMLNADGGSLVVGVSEAPGGRAAGLTGLVGVDWRDTRQALEQWLRNCLDPREAETFVQIPTYPIDVDGKHVFVIEVAPCPFGPVAVLDGRSTLIPLRRDTDTTYLTLSEAIQRMDVHARARYLELRSFWDAGQKEVRIDAGLFLKLHDEPDLLPVVTTPRMGTATMTELDPAVVELRIEKESTDRALRNVAMQRVRRLSELASQGQTTRTAQLAGRVLMEAQWPAMNAVIDNHSPVDQSFRIPLSEIRAIVRERSTVGASPPSLLLNLKLVFHLSRDTGHWSITT